MQVVSSRPFLRLATIGALVAALGLAACGRKGPLDPPPGASAVEPQAQQQPGLISPVGVTPIGGGSGSAAGSNDNGAGIDAAGRAQAPKGPKRPIPLDVLLN